MSSKTRTALPPPLEEAASGFRCKNRGRFYMRQCALLKQQIAIRTFQEWKETQPGLTSSRTGAPIVAPISRAATCIR